MMPLIQWRFVQQFTGWAEAAKMTSLPCDVAERLRDAEARAGLFAARVEEWSPWRVMRSVADRTAAGLPLQTPSSSSIGRVVQALLAGVSLFAILLRGRPVDLIVKTARSALREEVDGRFRDVNFDSLLDLSPAWLKIDEDNSPAFHERARRAAKPAQLDSSTFTLFGRVMGHLAPAPCTEFVTYAHGVLRQEFGNVLSIRQLKMRVSTVFWQARLFELLLARTRPLAVIVSNTSEYAIILACRRRGIPVIEIQHGVFDTEHPDAIPLSAGPSGALLIPDILAVRGQYWIRRLAGTHSCAIAVAVGMGVVDNARLLRSRTAAVRQCRIVVSSQGVDVQRLSEWLAEAVSLAPSDLDWEMTIKLHPTYDGITTAFDALSTHPRIRVVPGAMSPSLIDLLVGSTLHLSISSASHFDALALGVPSAVIPLLSWEVVAPAIAEGRLQKLSSPANIWDIDLKPLSADEAADFSEPGFLDNMDKLLRGLAATRRGDQIRKPGANAPEHS